MLGLPRVAVSARSPDGLTVAYVRNHPTIDGPSQSLWLVRSGQPERQLRRLGEDSDWCNVIVWSADSSTASYLVQDARLITVDSRSGNIVSEKWLTEWRGEYPPNRIVGNLAHSGDGCNVTFRDCPRRSAGQGCLEHELPVR